MLATPEMSRQVPVECPADCNPPSNCPPTASWVQPFATFTNRQIQQFLRDFKKNHDQTWGPAAAAIYKLAVACMVDSQLSQLHPAVVCVQSQDWGQEPGGPAG